MKELELFISNSDVSDAFEKSYKGDFNLEDIVKFFTSKNNLDYDFENKSCAIVGSSDNILNYKYGEEIDSHDYIIRSNAARLEGFEDWCGSRTDFRVISGKTFSSINHDKTNAPVPNASWFPRLKGEHFLVRSVPGGIERSFSVIDRHMNGKNKLNFIHEDLEKYSKEITGCIEASTGFIAILIGTMLFRTINIYGYSFYDGKNEQQTNHYYQHYPFSTGVIHRFDNELNVVKRLEKQGLLSIKNGEKL